MTKEEMFYAVLIAAAVIATIASWFTHIIYCFNEEMYGFLIAGALFFPVAMFHGIWLWF